MFSEIRQLLHFPIFWLIGFCFKICRQFKLMEEKINYAIKLRIVFKSIAANISLQPIKSTGEKSYLNKTLKLIFPSNFNIFTIMWFLKNFNFDQQETLNKALIRNFVMHCDRKFRPLALLHRYLEQRSKVIALNSRNLSYNWRLHWMPNS